jgi:hypothetical protein
VVGKRSSRGAPDLVAPAGPRIDFCDRGHTGMAKSWAMKPEYNVIRIYPCPGPLTPKGNMTVSQIPSSVVERRLAIARRLYHALVAQDPNRAITLCDAGGRIMARHDPRPEQDDPKIASQRRGSA